MNNSLVIGIDLGTTNSGASYYFNGKLNILENFDGGRITPSFLFFADQDPIVGKYAKGMAERKPESGIYEIKRLVGRNFSDPQDPIVGKYAKRMAERKPESGIYEIKRLVGRNFSDPQVQDNLKRFPFQVKSVNDNPIVVIETNNKIISKSPKELCTYILAKIKKDVESKLGCTIDKAVITVPAYFNTTQRKVTLEAANDAGFTVLKLLNEPTAAAIYYNYENDFKKSDNSCCLVYDLGGGTFDIAVVKKMENDTYEVKAVDGDSHLGGCDFDNRILDFVCKELQDKFGHNIENDRRIKRRLTVKCEDAKKFLSTAEETSIGLYDFLDRNKQPVEILLSRTKFNELVADLFRKTIDLVDRCLETAHLSKSDITEVILSGGSTRIPKIQELISEYFNGKTLNKFVNPDECVALGAALEAAMLSDNPRQEITAIKTIDVVPLSLGNEVLGGYVSFVIEKNTPIPVTKTTSQTTAFNNQTEICFEIYEGIRYNPANNNFIGTFSLSNLTPAPPGHCKIEFTMDIDKNGILTITASERFKNNTKSLTINYARGCRSDLEMRQVANEISTEAVEDLRFLAFAKSKESILKYCIRMMYNLEKENLTNSLQEVYDHCSKTKYLVKGFRLEQEAEMHEIKKNLIFKCQKIVEKHEFENIPTLE